MLGTFASVEKRVIGQGTCVAYKTYSKSHGQLVFRHYKRELWALKELAVVTREDSVQNHVTDPMSISNTMRDAKSFDFPDCAAHGSSGISQLLPSDISLLQRDISSKDDQLHQRSNTGASFSGASITGFAVHASAWHHSLRLESKQHFDRHGHGLHVYMRLRVCSFRRRPRSR